MERNQILTIIALLLLGIFAGALIYVDYGLSTSVMGDYLMSPMATVPSESEMYNKNMDIWFMLMMVAFLMIFIRKFEWGTALAVLLSAAGSFLAYMFIQQFYFGLEVWTQALMIRAVICSITIVIGIGVFLGLCKMWQYFLVGILFAPAYALLEYVLANGLLDFVATDPGGSMLVHMCAAYFGIGVALTLREKKSWDEPMYSSTHSVTFVWLGSMLLWILWPSFVTSLVSSEEATWGMITCYMAGLGSIVSTYFVTMICQGKVNPLIYTYAMLAGPVAIGSPMLSVGPWGALFIGVVAGAVSSLCFIYMQPVMCKLIGSVDMMGVHNLHGMAGWVGALSICLINLSIDNAIFAVVTCALSVGTGALAGIVIRLTRGKMDVIADDDTDFIKNEDPSWNC